MIPPDPQNAPFEPQRKPVQWISRPFHRDWMQLKFAFKILGVEFGKTICGDGGAEVVKDVSASFTEIGFFCIYPAKPKPTWSKIKPVYMTLILPTHIHARDIMH